MGVSRDAARYLEVVAHESSLLGLHAHYVADVGLAFV